RLVPSCQRRASCRALPRLPRRLGRGSHRTVADLPRPRMGGLMIRRTRFRNWSGYVHAHPNRYEQPGPEADLAMTVTAAAEAGQRIRVVGAGHSFTPIAAGDGLMLNLDRLAGIVSVDTARDRVRFLAGTLLRDVPALLAPYGLAQED